MLTALAVSRAPYVLLRGRLWAEEGSVHLQHMITSSFPGELLFVQGRAGYENLFANLATWGASLVPLRYAPLVTAWLSLGVVVLLAWVALRWPSDLLPVAWAKLAAAALLVVGTSAAPAAWLNAINAQTYLGVLTLLLLFVRLGELARRRFVLCVVLLVGAGLSGVYSAVLWPLFVVRALLDRTRRAVVCAAALSGAAAVQVAVMLRFRLSGAMAEEKSVLPGASEAAESIGRHVSGLVVGPAGLDRLSGGAGRGDDLLLAVVALAVVAVIGALLWSIPDRRVPLLLVGALVLSEVAVQIGSLAGGHRYLVVPVSTLALMVVHGVAVSPRRPLVRAGAAVGAVALLAGVAQFWTGSPSLLRCRGCPSWQDEVAAWEAGTTTELTIWPYDRGVHWVVVLPPPG